MASIEIEAIEAINSLSECCICFTHLTDPRTLSCFHTSCLKCFDGLQCKSKKKPGDVLPCPLCRKEFTIPPEGMNGLQKNFFIENLVKTSMALNSPSEHRPLCNTCCVMRRAGWFPKATMRCVDCCEIYCYRCSRMHTSQKLTRGHKLVKINRALSDDEIRNLFPTRSCSKHSDRMLDYYCSDCKIVVCVSCIVEDHKLHQCKDVKTIDKDFRRRLEENCAEVYAYLGEFESKKMVIEREKAKLQTRLVEVENEIKKKRDEMKVLIDQHTQQLLDDLSLMKQNHEKTIMMENEEIELQKTVLESFVSFCTELKTKGSPSDVCGFAENLISRSGELKEEFDQYLNAPGKSVEIEFAATDAEDLLENASNFIGELSESVKQLESYAIVIGRDDGSTMINEVIKINLSQSDYVSNLPPVPTKMRIEAASAVYCNSIFVTGIGNNYDEIWKFDGTSSSWKKCASLIRCRRRHSVAFVNHILYICGGHFDYYPCRATLDDVEAYDSINNASASVGKLKYAVMASGNCVSIKDSLYIFGGSDVKYNVLSSVQVYDTKTNTCSLLSNPMPRAATLLRAVMWNNSVILLGCFSCFIYRFDTETWQVRDQFKTDVYHFGLTVANGNIFVMGGDRDTTDADGMFKWSCSDDIKSVPIWNILNDEPIQWIHHAKLICPSMVHAFGEIKMFA